MYQDKFRTHKYYNEILKKFEENVSVKDIRNWLKSLGEEYTLAGDTIRRHQKRYDATRREKQELEKAKSEYGDAPEMEAHLLETIAQCRARKSSRTIGGKDFQYYDQQMQSAIQLLNKIRGNSESNMGMEEVFETLTKQIQDDSNQSTDTERADN